MPKSNQEKIAIDTVKNPNKSLLGGPTASEAEKMLRTKFDYTDKQIAKLKEEAPVNATGTNVAGTGDDSSTVVVKKKKKQQDKLMKRFKIKETLDRLVPDLEYPKDEITERKNQLKAMAVASINPNDKSDIQAEKKLAYDKKTDQPKKYVAGLSGKEKKSHDRHLENKVRNLIVISLLTNNHLLIKLQKLNSQNTQRNLDRCMVKICQSKKQLKV